MLPWRNPPEDALLLQSSLELGLKRPRQVQGAIQTRAEARGPRHRRPWWTTRIGTTENLFLRIFQKRIPLSCAASSMGRAAGAVALLLAAHAPLAAVGWSQWDATLEVRHPAACYSGLGLLCYAA